MSDVSPLLPPDLDFPEPWRDVRSDPDARDSLELELRREVGAGHPLHGVEVRAMAACDGHCDDVIYELRDGTAVVVHLSYPTDPPDRPPFPFAVSVGDRDELLAVVRSHGA